MDSNQTAATALPRPAQAVSNHRRSDLDFVRGIAILLAIGWHFNVRDTGWLPIDLLQWPGRTIGWAGVDIFFVLSGFLVGGLIFGEWQASGSFDARRFLVRRVFKIWPVLYLYVLLLVVTGRYAWQDIVPQTLFHVQNYFLTPAHHLWSLAVEEHFYLAFAFSFAWFVRSGRSTKGIVACLGLLMALPLLARVVALAAGADPHTLQVQTQFRADALACGVLMAYLRTARPDAFHRLQRRKAVWITTAALSALVLAGLRGNAPWICTLGYSLGPVLGASLLLLVYDNRLINSHSPFTQWLAWIGTYSYAMYVFQF